MAKQKSAKLPVPEAQQFEKLGAFYLGRTYDLEQDGLQPGLLLYDAKDLTTHAVCVGMTGSGKTGLCLSLLEEAAIDGIPAIAIDPKGDLSNLALTFPNLQPGDFQPWIDPGEAVRAGEDVPTYAGTVANLWKNGLADWGEDGARIAKFREAVDLTIYTPASQTGVPLTVLRRLTAPAPAVLADAEALRDRISSASAALLALLQIDADPVRSREQILICNIIEHHWRAGRDIDMPQLIREIQSPPIERVGFVDLETFFPAQERFELAMRLNNLLASPQFAAWLEGESLDVQSLLYTSTGKPRLSIISISHLSDEERMFFVTILLSEVLAWVRAQSGTSSLRALLYMDEVFGYFPPTANPPSKQPMLTLLKQARAFGLGVVLATQNPVDLDYKGLSNAGTWFLGRLQTERDKARVMEGLEGASAQAGKAFDRQKMEATLARLGRRVFLMNNVHDDQPVVFQTRWALSYLRGPLTRDQIKTLMKDKVAEHAASGASEAAAQAPSKPEPIAPNRQGERVLLSPKIPQAFLPPTGLSKGDGLLYRPALYGIAKVHYIDSKSDVDLWRDFYFVRPAEDDVSAEPWDEADGWASPPQLEDDPIRDDARFGELADDITRSTSYTRWKTALKNYLYGERPLALFYQEDLKLYSQPGETEGEFRARARLALSEQRDLEVEKLRAKYASKMATLEDRIRKAEQKVEREKEQATQHTYQAAISFGTTLLGALFGRKLASRTNLTKASSSMRAAGRAAQQRSDVGRAEDDVKALQDELADMEKEFQGQVDELSRTPAADQLAVVPYPVTCRKSDLHVENVTLLWLPWSVDSQGIAEPAYELPLAQS